MARPRARAKMNIPICLAGVLLCLTMFSFHLSSGVVARYTTTASGTDTARVIKFGDITVTKYGENTQYIIPGTQLTWNAAVSFEGSEATTILFLEVRPAGNCVVTDGGKTYTLSASGAQWTVSDKWDFHKDDSGTYVYYIELDANKGLTNESFFSSNNSTLVPADLPAATLEAVGTISADIRASVVQSNGFTTVDAAWTSLKSNS